MRHACARAQAAHAGGAATRREATAALAHTLAGARAGPPIMAKAIAERALKAGAPAELHRLVTFGGEATAEEAARLVEELALCGGEPAARALVCARVPAALAAAAPAANAVAAALEALADGCGAEGASALGASAAARAARAAERIARLGGREGAQGEATLTALMS